MHLNSQQIYFFGVWSIVTRHNPNYNIVCFNVGAKEHLQTDFEGNLKILKRFFSWSWLVRLPYRQNDGKGMYGSVEQAFVGRDEPKNGCEGGWCLPDIQPGLCSFQRVFVFRIFFKLLNDVLVWQSKPTVSHFFSCWCSNLALPRCFHSNFRIALNNLDCTL